MVKYVDTGPAGHSVDLPSVIKRRLRELGIEQKELAAAARVTESYVSQLLSRRKAPPAPDRTDIYGKMEELLRFPAGELSRLASLHRQEDVGRKAGPPPRPLYKEFRELILRKCEAGKRGPIRTTFESAPFGELERLVTQKLLDVAQRVARRELENEGWLRRMARLAGHSYEQMRVTILEFLDTDVYSVSADNCVSFLDPLIESWSMDLETFGMEIVLSPRLAFDPFRRFEFVETGGAPATEVLPGFAQFLDDSALSGDATEEEIEFLKGLKFKGRQPTALYYYRELQSLRDPLHFSATRADSEGALHRKHLRGGPPVGQKGGKSASSNARR